MHGYFAGLVAYRPELLPFAASKLREPLSEFRYARTLGIQLWNADRKVETREGAAIVPGFFAKPPD
jgi:hypothetical protein